MRTKKFETHSNIFENKVSINLLTSAIFDVLENLQHHVTGHTLTREVYVHVRIQNNIKVSIVHDYSKVLAYRTIIMDNISITDLIYVWLCSHT